MDDFILKAIPALLKDPDAKAALLDYLKVQADKDRPKEEWRDVWWQLSEDVRRLDGKDPATAINNPKVRLYVRSQYSYRNVGVLYAFIVNEYFDGHGEGYWRGRYYDGFEREPFHHEAFEVKDYTDVITASQKAWDSLHTKWERATLPLEDGK